ncbi:hypothetical protein Bca4012_032443 [Brassica carinata]|uniref:(rape) hypothetical protein n=1 Tax=Brassica napus TaxID=3708 RepID=A0A816JQN6_BRANA|nr:unnamed protein product [Brassica napus]
MMMHCFLQAPIKWYSAMGDVTRVFREFHPSLPQVVFLKTMYIYIGRHMNTYIYVLLWYYSVMAISKNGNLRREKEKRKKSHTRTHIFHGCSLQNSFSSLTKFFDLFQH